MRYLAGLAALEKAGVSPIVGTLKAEGTVLASDYVVFTNESIYIPGDSNLHTCRIPGAEKYTEDGCCTIPLAYLQAASQLRIHEVILLGLLVCSYREGQKPLCTVRELRDCALQLKGHRGRRKVLQATQYLQEDCRSPMEALCYMLIRLPNALGGLNIKEAVFNHEIKLPGIGSRFADIYIPSKKVVIEYNSEKYHNNKNSFYQDRQREVDLANAGYKVITITYEQIKNPKRWQSLAEYIARSCGKKIIIRARKFVEGFVWISDLIKHVGRGIRQKRNRIQRSELPNFRGVNKVYKLYENAQNRFHAYPWQPLLLTQPVFPKLSPT